MTDILAHVRSDYEIIRGCRAVAKVHAHETHTQSDIEPDRQTYWQRLRHTHKLTVRYTDS